MSEVDARLFGFDFGTQSKRIYKVNNVTLLPNDLTDSDITSIGLHLQTGIARVIVDDSDFDRCIDQANSILQKVDSLLTFAQQRSIFVNDFRCYTKENDERKLRYRKLVAKRSFAYKEHLTPISIIPVGLIEDFLQHCLPLLDDSEFQKKTGVKYALNIFNETITNKMTVEFAFVTLFFALEVLASSHAKANNRDILVDDTEYKAISSTISKVLESLIDDAERRSRILQSLLSIKREHIREKITFLANSYHVDMNEKLVSSILHLRNEIVHGVEMSEIDKAIETLRGVELLLENLILAIFGYKFGNE